MAIGDHIRKYQEAKAREAAEADTIEVIEPAPESAPPAPKASTADLLAKMVELLAEIRTSPAAPSDKERLALEAERLLLEQERVKREMPENKQAPGISVYSYPEGDLKHPKPALKCKMFWVGYELNTDTLKPVEIDLLNKLSAGEFRVMKSDSTVIPFRVSAKHNDRFQLEELSVWFPCKGDHRHNHGSMISYLQQALGEHIPTADELLKEVTRLRAELASAQTGAMSAV